MESFLFMFFSSPLQFLVVILTIWFVTIRRFEERALREVFLVAIVAAIAALTAGCATTTTEYADGRKVTTTSFGGGPVVQGSVAGGLAGGAARALGASHNLALGFGVAVAASVAADGARRDGVAGYAQRNIPEICKDSNLEFMRIGEAKCTEVGGQWIGRCKIDCTGVRVGPSAPAVAVRHAISNPVNGNCPARHILIMDWDRTPQKCVPEQEFASSVSKACLHVMQTSSSAMQMGTLKNYWDRLERGSKAAGCYF